MARIQLSLDRLSRTVDVAAPWTSPRATELDSISLEEWLDQKRAGRHTRSLFTLVSKVQWGCTSGDVSMLHVLHTIRAFGGLDHMLDVEDGQQEERYAETTQEIAIRYAVLLGDRVRTSSPVRRITQDVDGVVVDTGAARVRAQYVVVTTATEHRADIAFEPSLPEAAQGLARSWGLGRLSKAFVAYDTPFWREDGLSGEGLTDTGTAFITFDVSPGPDGPGVMMVFCDPRVFDAHPPEVRRAQVARQLTDLYGPRAAHPIDYVDHCWGADTFAPGGPNPAVAPYAITRYGAVMTEPHGRVHWAGTETAGEWGGSMNGAVLSGQRVAHEVGRLLAHAYSGRPAVVTAGSVSR
jgi:monoamine oxidase